MNWTLIFLDYSAICSTTYYQKDNGSIVCGIYAPKNLNFDKAEEQCTLYGARLPEIQSAKENQDLLERVVSIDFLMASGGLYSIIYITIYSPLLIIFVHWTQLSGYTGDINAL